MNSSTQDNSNAAANPPNIKAAANAVDAYKPAIKLERRADEPSSDIKSFRANEPQLYEEKTTVPSPPSRLIFIGDIHGCVEYFNKLLETVEFKQGSDQVVLVGDLVAKGPDSLGVVNKARSIGAWGTRGNHDDRVVRWGDFLQGPGKGLSESDLESLQSSGDLPYDDFEIGGDHYDIASTMPACDFSYLARFPTMIVLPPPYNEWVVAHGGIVPTTPIAQQNPDDVMTMRNIGPDGPSSKKDAGEAWFDVWAEKIGPLGGNSTSVESSSSDTTSKDDEQTNRKRQISSPSLDTIQFKKVIYGHDAGRDLQIHEFTKGLDSRCVYGGKLTAFILPGEQLVSVDCGKDYTSGDSDQRRRRDMMLRRAQTLRSNARRRRKERRESSRRSAGQKHK
ncbi:hypothetical protein IWW36_002969 [Coemansia brasiliensis]|uniref:Calcineurin-like phosphoesterase domain-containing protein n=1 Tax=Coemansia brasiliensis TaxID=2650707 RepID=A0A9W8M0I0_9FUNG|nr:hypothetical protein IWW36_002969 [Coemansia brasiliensis]